MLTLYSFVLALICFAAQPLLADTNTPQVVDVGSFGAVGDGTTDCTAAFREALGVAGAAGGSVTVPAGRFRLTGSIEVPTGVTLQGSWKGPHHGVWKQGSTLLVTGGRGSEEGPAAVEMAPASTVRGLTFVYPEQQLSDVQPYPWTLHGKGMHCTVENVTLVNSYNGIAMGPDQHELHMIRNVFGCVLRRGILVDSCTDIGRIENVHFNPHYWVRAHYPGTPGTWRVPTEGGKHETRHPQWYMLKHLEGFIFGRTDWEYVLNTFVFGAKIGYRFIETAKGKPNGNFLGIGADWCTVCLQSDATQAMGLLITNGEFVGNRTCENAILVNGGVVQLANCNFWGYQKRNLLVRGNGIASLNQCFFRDWGPLPKGVPVVEAQGGMLTLQGCTFMRERIHVRLGDDVKTAVIFGNTFVGPPVIENASEGDVKIDLNASAEPPPKKKKKKKK